jgi:hypothetical protein
MVEHPFVALAMLIGAVVVALWFVWAVVLSPLLRWGLKRR